jgi:hypothetical protein
LNYKSIIVSFPNLYIQVYLNKYRISNEICLIICWQWLEFAGHYGMRTRTCEKDKNRFFEWPLCLWRIYMNGHIHCPLIALLIVNISICNIMSSTYMVTVIYHARCNSLPGYRFTIGISNICMIPVSHFTYMQYGYIGYR